MPHALRTHATRRDFLKLAAAAEPTPIPTRPFGSTGIDVPILSFGGSPHLPQLMLRQAVRWGVTYWDTANSYMGGNAEKRIGKCLKLRDAGKKVSIFDLLEHRIKTVTSGSKWMVIRLMRIT